MLVSCDQALRTGVRVISLFGTSNSGSIVSKHTPCARQWRVILGNPQGPRRFQLPTPLVPQGRLQVQPRLRKSPSTASHLLALSAGGCLSRPASQTNRRLDPSSFVFPMPDQSTIGQIRSIFKGKHHATKNCLKVE